jgi:hypothetical protein
MSSIVNTGSPSLILKKQLRARLSCPNCDSTFDLDADAVDIGHIIRCDECEKKTYYPFERPWYRRRKLVLGYIASLIVSFVVGIAVNFAYAKITKVDPPATITSERN